MHTFTDLTEENSFAGTPLANLLLPLTRRYLSDYLKLLKLILRENFSSKSDVVTKLSLRNTCFTRSAISKWIESIWGAFIDVSFTESCRKRSYNVYTRRYQGYYTHYKTISEVRVRDSSYLRTVRIDLKKALTDDNPELIFSTMKKYLSYLIQSPKKFEQRKQGITIKQLISLHCEPNEVRGLVEIIFAQHRENIFLQKFALLNFKNYEQVLQIAIKYKKKDWIVTLISTLYAFLPPNEFLNIFSFRILNQVATLLHLDLSFFRTALTMI